MGASGGQSGSRSRVKGTVALVAIALLILFAGRHGIQDRLRDSIEWLDALGLVGLVLFVALYIAAAALLVPGSALTLGAGFIWGLPKGVLIVSVASTLAATTSFLIGRYFARGWVTRKTADSPRLRALDDAVMRGGWKIVALTRLSPAFPYTLLNYAFGLTRIPLGHYVVVSWVSMIPGTIMYVYLGSLGGAAAQGGASWWVWALRGLGFAATVALTVVITRVATRSLRSVPEGPDSEGAA